MAKPIKSQMPALTIDGKRQLIKQAVQVHGKKNVEKWLLTYNLVSLKIAMVSVRKLRPSFFRELYQWTNK